MLQFELPNAVTMSELKKRSVISKDEYKIGTIIEAVFTEDLELHSFLIGGSRWEEFREALGVVDDIDPVILVKNIVNITDEIIELNITKSRLKHKLEEDVLPDDVIYYNELKRKRVVDANGNKFARVVNFVLLPSGEVGFVLGGTRFEELSEQLKLKENVDLFLPIEFIDRIEKGKLHLTISYADLHLTKDNLPLDEETQQEYFNSLKAPKQGKIQLLCKRSIEEHRDFSCYLYQK
ncbi:MAG: hypothetical protein DRP02_08555 [Candidatus Gerdarchaeota archaeon]|nr:MAG: hypothetical protein DRP02_08555 [Candidatus Gerdarchaeota archaeon]